MYKLKAFAKRSSAFGASAALVAATVMPSATALANSLNPLTQRSLLLSSSAPGWQETDGSGNSAGAPNAIGEYYAPPGSGPNGKKTGQTFSFRVSTDSSVLGEDDEPVRPIRAFSLQYCTTAAGFCQAPGNNSGDARADSRESNEVAHAKPQTEVSGPTSDLDVVMDELDSWEEGTGPGTFQVTVDGVASEGWEMDVKNVEDDDYDGPLTGKNNFIFLTNSGAGATPGFNRPIEIKFTPDDDNYITNPGDDAFFVKINTYSVATEAGLLPTTNENVIDGGVTVANVMTDSIHITTKVLETMAFSVGTENPDTQPVQHGSCDAMDVGDNNRLNLGNHNAEYSLETTRAWDVYSYWRLSSNSSAGATVYYSGDTLRNTVGDHIDSMEAKAHSQPGTEQFGLAVIDAGQDTLDSVNSFPHNHVSNMLDDVRTSWVYPLGVLGDYADGGYVLDEDEESDTFGEYVLLPISDATTSNNAQFRFNASSQTEPEVIAQNTDQVISCATAKVRYVGNIAADTPAGVYTTKINYLAAPQY